MENNKELNTPHLLCFTLRILFFNFNFQKKDFVKKSFALKRFVD